MLAQAYKQGSVMLKLVMPLAQALVLTAGVFLCHPLLRLLPARSVRLQSGNQLAPPPRRL